MLDTFSSPSIRVYNLSMIWFQVVFGFQWSWVLKARGVSSSVVISEGDMYAFNGVGT